MNDYDDQVRNEWARRFASRFSDPTWSWDDRAAYKERLRLYAMLGAELRPEHAVESLAQATGRGAINW